MAQPKQPVSINGIEFDALITEDRGLEATVPEYAVEDGFSVSDTIIIGTETLSMTLFITDTPVTWFSRHGSGRGRTESIVKQLEELFYTKTPVTVVTSDRTFSDMAIESISFSKNAETGYAREIPISLRKIRITKARTTTIPDSYGKSGDTGASAGTANTSTANSGSTPSSNNSASSSGEAETKSSILYSVAKSTGLLGE